MRIKEISAEECRRMLAEEQTCVVDVRPREMAEKPCIRGVRNIPLAELSWQGVQELMRPQQSLVFICQRGVSSLKACELISQQGFKGVCFSVKGGFSSW